MTQRTIQKPWARAIAACGGVVLAVHVVTKLVAASVLSSPAWAVPPQGTSVVSDYLFARAASEPEAQVPAAPRNPRVLP